MGGFGSGRGQGRKDTTNNMRRLDIRKLQREGQLKPGRSSQTYWKPRDRIMALIQINAEAGRIFIHHLACEQGMKYPVFLEWTPCNLGGGRAWFLCPGQGCGRRVAILHGGNSTRFACRHCHKLAYECQRETDDDRACRRADTIRRRLGWKAGIANPIGDKPKGMHLRTYLRLLNQHNAFANASWAGMAERLGLMNRRMGGLWDDVNGGG